MDKINRMAANFGIDENFAAAVQAHLKTIGAIPDDAPVEGDGQATDSADSAASWEERTRLGRPFGEVDTSCGFFYSKRP
jgi:hypothetical protein